VIARDPGAVFAREAFNVWDHLRRDAAELLGWPVAWCALLGLVFALRDGTWRKLWPVALAGALLFLTLVPAFYSTRYSLPLLPIHAAFAGWLFASPTLALVLSRARGVWLKPALALIPLTLSLRTSVNEQQHYFTQLPYEVLESARTLHEQGKPGDRIIARKPHIGFHSGLELVPFPFTKTLPDLGRYAREKNARWIYFSWLEAELRPEYVYLLDTTAVVPGLTVRHATFGHPSVLYEIGPELGIEPGWLHNDTLVAIHQLRSQLLIHSTNVEALYQLATIERLRGNFDQAFQLMDRATQLAPNEARFWLLLGDIRLRLHDPVTADAAFVRALTLDPSNAEAQIGRGWASLYANRPRDAAELWRPVVAAAHDPTTLQQMIELYGQLGDTESQSAARATLARLMGGR